MYPQGIGQLTSPQQMPQQGQMPGGPQPQMMPQQGQMPGGPQPQMMPQQGQLPGVAPMSQQQAPQQLEGIGLNLAKTQERLKDLADGQLLQYLQTGGGAPPVLVLGELNRRKRMRDGATEAPQQTVADELFMEALQRGIGGLSRQGMQQGGSPYSVPYGGPMSPARLEELRRRRIGVVEAPTGGVKRATHVPRWLRDLQAAQIGSRERNAQSTIGHDPSVYGDSPYAVGETIHGLDTAEIVSRTLPRSPWWTPDTQSEIDDLERRLQAVPPQSDAAILAGDRSIESVYKEQLEEQEELARLQAQLESKFTPFSSETAITREFLEGLTNEQLIANLENERARLKNRAAINRDAAIYGSAVSAGPEQSSAIIRSIESELMRRGVPEETIMGSQVRAGVGRGQDYLGEVREGFGDAWNRFSERKDAFARGLSGDLSASTPESEAAAEAPPPATSTTSATPATPAPPTPPTPTGIAALPESDEPVVDPEDPTDEKTPFGRELRRADRSNINIPLMMAGLAMLSSQRPDFFGALGEGGVVGLQAMMKLRQQEESRLDREAEREARAADRAEDRAWRQYQQKTNEQFRRDQLAQQLAIAKMRAQGGGAPTQGQFTAARTAFDTIANQLKLSPDDLRLFLQDKDVYADAYAARLTGRNKKDQLRTHMKELQDQEAILRRYTAIMDAFINSALEGGGGYDPLSGTSGSYGDFDFIGW